MGFRDFPSVGILSFQHSDVPLLLLESERKGKVFADAVKACTTRQTATTLKTQAANMSGRSRQVSPKLHIPH